MPSARNQGSSSHAQQLKHLWGNRGWNLFCSTQMRPEEGMVYLVKNVLHRELSHNRFPGGTFSQDDMHPLFFLSVDGNKIKTCPCSTKKKSKNRYIERGCKAKDTGEQMKKQSFLVESICGTVHAISMLDTSGRYIGHFLHCVRGGA